MIKTLNLNGLMKKNLIRYYEVIDILLNKDSRKEEIKIAGLDLNNLGIEDLKKINDLFRRELFDDSGIWIYTSLMIHFDKYNNRLLMRDRLNNDNSFIECKNPAFL